MKYLTQFFDASRFFDAKALLVLGITDWIDRDTQVKLGKIVDLVIVDDKTNYQKKSADEPGNEFEKIKVKVSDSNFNIAVKTHVRLENVTAKVWGDFNNNLSVTGSADSFKILNPKSSANTN